MSYEVICNGTKPHWCKDLPEMESGSIVRCDCGQYLLAGTGTFIEWRKISDRKAHRLIKKCQPTVLAPPSAEGDVTKGYVDRMISEMEMQAPSPVRTTLLDKEIA